MQNKLKPYPKYKDSGIEWLGEVPEGWLKSKVSWDMPYVVGWTPSTSNYEYYQGDLPWVTIDDMKKKIVTSTKKQLSKNAIADKGIRIVPKGSLLFSFKLSVGKMAYAGSHLYTNEAIASFLPNNKVNLGFLYYLAPYFLPHYGQHNIYGALLMNQELISSARTFIPPINEQATIAHYLDQQTAKIDQLVEKYQQLIALSKEKRTALITHCVTKGLDPRAKMKDSGIEWLGEVPEGWDISKCRHHFAYSKGLTITKENLQDHGIPCINYGEVHSKYGFEFNPKFHQLKCVSPEYLLTSKNSLLSYGDFVFADTSEDIEGSGNFTYLNSHTNVFAGYHTIIARMKSESNRFRYLAYLFDSSMFRVQIQNMVKGIKVYSITQAILKDAILWIPPLSEQTTIAHYLDQQTAKIDQVIDKAQQAIALLKEKRISLITHVVTGKADVRGLV